MTLVVPQARVWCFAFNRKPGPRAELFECGCKRAPMPYALSVLWCMDALWGALKKAKQQLDMNVCVSKQTNQRAVVFVGRWLVRLRWWGGGLYPPPFLWPRVWVLRREADAHRWAAVSAPFCALFHYLPFTPSSIHKNLVCRDSQ